MSWIKKDTSVEVQEELSFENSSISVTDAYEVTITDAHIQESAAQDSKSMSLVVGVKNEEGETNRTFLTLVGRDGNTFYMGKDGKKKSHFGLAQANTMFGIVLGSEIFDNEPEEVEYEQWDKDEKKMVKVKGQGFPALIGQTVGITLQMYRELNGADSKEYGNITHFFSTKTGLLYNEEDSNNRRLDKWLKTKKEFIVKTIEQQTSSFGKKKETAEGETPKQNRWGSKS